MQYRSIVANWRESSLAAIARLAMALALAGTFSGVADAANTVCNNGQCVSCDGSLICVNNACTCNGAPVGSTNAQPASGPCGSEPTVVHDNGGGRVSVSASVDASVYVSGDSAVCGRAVVSGPVRLNAGSAVNGTAHVGGSSTLTRSTINGTASVQDSTLDRSAINGSAKVVRSQLARSTVNGNGSVTDSNLTSVVVNGNASIANRTVQNSVLNR
jgi:hypothetical protein